MKLRVISSIFMLILLVPIIISGGMIFDIAVYLISLFALKEFLDIKENKKLIPNLVKIICYIIFTFIVFGTAKLENSILTIDFRIISALFLTFLIPTVLYHDKKIYSINDAFYLIGSILFLGMAFSAMIIFRNKSIFILIYLILISVLTDVYAYFGGYFIGKHKLIPEISPNKTWEGSLIGTLFCTFACSIFYHMVINNQISYWIIIGMTLLLSIISQFGDLVFSSIKRYFDKKDFSHLIPGHGGILDRLDSMIFVMLGFMFIVSVI